MKKYTLPREFAEKWVEALRSGEYKQGVFALETADHRFCCLGVACKINDISTDGQYIGYVEYGNKYIGNKIPILLKGTGNDNDFLETLIKMNDGNDSFDDIANYIERVCEFI